MKALVLVLPLMAAASPALAQSRLDSLTSSCQTARRAVQDGGAVIIGTGRFVYDRFVRDQSYCPLSQITEPAWLPTANDPQCFVGYRCRDRGPRGGS